MLLAERGKLAFEIDDDLLDLAVRLPGLLFYFRQMASITVSVPNDLASEIRAPQLPGILELGLRELNADARAGFDGAPDVLELLAASGFDLLPGCRLALRNWWRRVAPES